jgi:hypothetical protein
MMFPSIAKVSFRHQAPGETVGALGGGKNRLFFHCSSLCHPAKWLLYFNNSTMPPFPV